MIKNLACVLLGDGVDAISRTLPVIWRGGQEGERHPPGLAQEVSGKARARAPGSDPDPRAVSGIRISPGLLENLRAAHISDQD